MSATLIKEARISRGFQATVPGEIRERLDIDAGDILRWKLVDGELGVEVVRRKRNALKGLIGRYRGPRTDSVREHNLSPRR